MKNLYMRVYLVSYDKEEISDVSERYVLPNYDGDVYGDSVPFSVGSNQTIVKIEDATPRMKEFLNRDI